MMEDNSIEIDGATIFYLEKNKQASCTLFFIHGNSCSSNLWRKQYLSELFTDYRLVVFDLPGHGKSEMLPFESYSLTAIGEIMSKAVALLADNKPFILVGLSLGTNVVCEMLFENIAPVGIVLAGASIVGNDYKVEDFIYKDTHVYVVFSDEVTDEDVAAYAAETSASSDPLDKEMFLRDYWSTSKQARPLLAKSISEGRYKDELKILKDRNIPTLIIFGAQERIVHPDYLDNAGLPLLNGGIDKIENASHIVNVDQPEQFNRLLYDYSQKIFI